MTQEPAHVYLRHGLAPFFRLRRADLEAGLSAGLAAVDAALLGVPWDGGVTYRPGARFAPYELRRVSALLQSYHPGHAIDVFARLRTVDAGNVPLAPFGPAAAREAVEASVAALVDAGTRPFLVGGDHSITLPALRALARRHGPLAMIHIDAHLDTSTAATWGEAIHHGTVIRNACDEGQIARHQLYQLGVRATWATSSDGDYACEHGGRRYGVDRITDTGAATLAQQIARGLGDHPVYVSLDVDAIDPAFAPGTGTPVPGGLSSREALALLRGLAGINLVGMDLVEVCPALDHADITLHLGAALLYEGLALAAIAVRDRSLVTSGPVTHT